MRRSLDLALIVAAAALANFVYLYCSDGDYFYPDSITYLGPAKMLLSGHGFSIEPGIPDLLRTPVYPLFLAAFGTHVLPVIVFQHLLNVALAVAIYFFTLRQGRFAAVAAALIFAVDPPSIHYANKVLTETLFTVLLFVVFVLAERAPVITGLLTGILVITRPVAIAYFVVLAILRGWRRATALFVVAALALPLGWAVRNQIAGGAFTISTIGAGNLLEYRAAGAMAIADEGDFDQDLLTEQRDLLQEVDDLIVRNEHTDEVSEGVRVKYYRMLARRVILQHPIAFALLTLRGLLVNIFDSDWDAIMIVSRLESRTIQIALDVFVALVFALAVLGVIALWRRDRPLALLIAGTVGYFLFISAGGEAEARFRVPVVPQIAIAAACGLQVLKNKACAP
ncbi:MAG TPA: hypothetical protein VJZ76_19745 [Thermoanaerobaculia bacterium]|nr:hypothetical protein [Thermoanaerobaculia bacterium]